MPQTSEQAFLHYNILFGVDAIGESWKVFYAPFLGFFILIINALLGWILYRKDKFMAQILNFITCLCQIFIVIASFLLVFLNI